MFFRAYSLPLALSFGMGICGTAVTGLAILQRLGLPDCPKQRRDFENYINAHNTTAHTTVKRLKKTRMIYSCYFDRFWFLLMIFFLFRLIQTAHPPVTLWKAEPLLLAQCIPSDVYSILFCTFLNFFFFLVSVVKLWYSCVFFCLCWSDAAGIGGFFHHWLLHGSNGTAWGTKKKLKKIARFF